jgi:hypothetical protein
MSVRYRSSLLSDTQLRKVTGILLAVRPSIRPRRVTGRTTLAALLWLVTWGVLHLRWKAREVDTGRICPATLILIALGILGTFPPAWKLFQTIEWRSAVTRLCVLSRAGTLRPDRRRPPHR